MAMKLGTADYVIKPVAPADWRSFFERLSLLGKIDTRKAKTYFYSEGLQCATQSLDIL